MKDRSPQEIVFIICTIIGISLLAVNWFTDGGTTGFFLLLIILCLVLLRWRIKRMDWTSVLDVFVCLVFAPAFLGIGLFFAMYRGMYFTMLAIIYVFISFDLHVGLLVVLGGALGLLLRFWEQEREKRLAFRDEETGKFYQLESLQASLMQATRQIEQMTVDSERARIAREIHDNAGHEIIAAYISLQTVRNMVEGSDALELYDTALTRLSTGVDKIREAVHNLAPVAAIGIESLQATCDNFPQDVDFKAFGDTGHIPVYVWHVLESCLSENLTNIAKHAHATEIIVELDATPHIVRLCVKNDGVLSSGNGIGSGLRNLRYRVRSIGGSLAVVNEGGWFSMVCVVGIGDKFR